VGEIVEKGQLLKAQSEFWHVSPFCVPSFGLEKAALNVGLFVSLVVLLDMYLIFFTDIPVLRSCSQS